MDNNIISSYVYFLENKLDQSLEKKYYEDIKWKVLNKYSDWTEDTFIVTWTELKRFFIMKAIMKSVDMYSNNVDLVWHEMLLFTKEYQLFCMNFIDDFIHHEPHIGENITIDSNSRAWFDWVYLQLFEVQESSWKLWNGFLFHPLGLNTIDQFEEKNKMNAINKCFNVKFLDQSAEGIKFIDELICRFKQK